MRRTLLLCCALLFVLNGVFAKQRAMGSKNVKVGLVTNCPSMFSGNMFYLLGDYRADEKQNGKYVLDYLLKRNTGKLHFEHLYEMALMNTTPEEIEEALQDKSAEMRDVLKRDISRQLMKNCFIVDVEKISNDNGIKDKFDWAVYKVDINDNIIEQVFECWDDLARYDLIEVPIREVAKGRSTVASGNYGRLLKKIEGKVPELATRGPLVSRHPFVTRVGRKDVPLKKGDLMYVYRNHSNERGELYSKKVCSARTTQIGDTETRLYYVGGKFPSMKKGDIAVYAGPHRAAWSVMGAYSMGSDARYGLRLQYERMLGFSKGGLASYFLFNVEGGSYGKEPDGAWYDPKINKTVNQRWMLGGGNFGYGLGVNLLGRIELMPYITIGAQCMACTNSKALGWNYDEKKWTPASDGIALSLVGYTGLKLNINLWYPVQFTIAADYNFNQEFVKNSMYKGHELNRLNFYAGFRFNL